jgi:hypothetical protein
MRPERPAAQLVAAAMRQRTTAPAMIRATGPDVAFLGSFVELGPTMGAGVSVPAIVSSIRSP